VSLIVAPMDDYAAKTAGMVSVPARKNGLHCFIRDYREYHATLRGIASLVVSTAASSSPLPANLVHDIHNARGDLWGW